MNKKNNIAWKVVKPVMGHLRSAFRHHGFPVIYSKSHSTSGFDANHPLFCLRTRQSARNYAKSIHEDIDDNYRVVVVKVKILQKGELPNFPCVDIPEDTVFAHRVIVID